MSREEMHALLDAACELNDSGGRYYVDLSFYTDWNGLPAASYHVHDAQRDRNLCLALGKSSVVASGIVADSCLTVWDAIRAFAHYKKGGKNED